MLALAAGCSRQPEQPAGTATGAPVPDTRGLEVDVDEDGVPDRWEDADVLVTLPSGQTERLDLRRRGGSSDHKDIYVWVSWMGAGPNEPAGHQPHADALSDVAEAFAAAPGIVNPDGKPGIRLHTFVRQRGVQHINYLGTTDAKRNYDWSAFDAIRDGELPSMLRGRFHFALFAHRLGGLATTSGAARGTPGRNLVVSLGVEHPNRQYQAGTFMHELGHDLGLKHGGLDNVERKPNYLSVMNYSFQLDGLIKDGGEGHFDYSRFVLPSQHENKLDRRTGLSPNSAWAAYGTHVYCRCNGQSTPVISIGAPIDWDCSERHPAAPPTVVRHDVDLSCAIEELTGAEDWSRIVLRPPSSPPPLLERIEELTDEVARQIVITPVAAVSARIAGNAARISWAPKALDLVYGYRVYRQAAEGPRRLVGATELTSFDDTTVAAGTAYSYSVSAIVGNRGGVTRLPLEGRPVVEFLVKNAPNRMRSISVNVADVDVPGPGAPQALFETMPSRSATIFIGERGT